MIWNHTKNVGLYVTFRFSTGTRLDGNVFTSSEKLEVAKISLFKMMTVTYSIKRALSVVGISMMVGCTLGLHMPLFPSNNILKTFRDEPSASLSTKLETNIKDFRAPMTVISAIVLVSSLSFSVPAYAVENGGGATAAANAKITTGGASTLQSGRTIAITRGVNLDRSDFSNQNLKGVAFQQSIIRDSSFKGSNLFGSSFFDATLDGTNFEDADMTQANIEMAQFNRANLHNTIMKEVYVSGATLFEGVDNIAGSDWTDTFLRKDQQKYLCSHPTAKGTNPITGVETRESLICKD